jgi:hypothetical protein
MRMCLALQLAVMARLLKKPKLLLLKVDAILRQ